MAVGAGIQANFVKPRIAEAFGFVNDELAGKEFFVGNELTGADSESPCLALCFSISLSLSLFFAADAPEQKKKRKRRKTLMRIRSLAHTVMMMFPCEGLEAGQGNLDKYPNIEKWIRKMQARPAYKRAEQKGGANDLTVFTK